MLSTSQRRLIDHAAHEVRLAKEKWKRHLADERRERETLAREMQQLAAELQQRLKQQQAAQRATAEREMVVKDTEIAQTSMGPGHDDSQLRAAPVERMAAQDLRTHHE